MLRLITLLMLTAVSLVSHSASFDCKKARTETEKIICADAQISKLDEQLAIAYKAASDAHGATADNKAFMKLWQRNWLDSRGACGDAACMKALYTAQINELNEFAAGAANTISGKYERYVQGKRDVDPASLLVATLKLNRVRVIGEALWIGNAKLGNINTGEVNDIAPIKDNIVRLDAEKNTCPLTITFTKTGLTISDDKGDCGGVNVTFNGEYRKVSSTSKKIYGTK